MSTQHTPGPWKVNGDGTALWIDGFVNDDHHEFVPVAEIVEYNPDQARANARLIAAAPKLLEALEELIRSNFQHGMVKVTPEMFAIIKQARDAIAEAKGELRK